MAHVQTYRTRWHHASWALPDGQPLKRISSDTHMIRVHTHTFSTDIWLPPSGCRRSPREKSEPTRNYGGGDDRWQMQCNDRCDAMVGWA